MVPLHRNPLQIGRGGNTNGALERAAGTARLDFAPMPGTTKQPSAPAPAAIERWLGALGIEAGARAEREGVVAWDLVVDGRTRRDLRVTLILDPALGMIVWAHLAPP